MPSARGVAAHLLGRSSARPQAPGWALNALQMPQMQELGDSAAGTVPLCASCLIGALRAGR